MKFGLLGRTLKHSFSPQIHAHLGKYDYALYEVEPEDLGNFLKNSDFSGINVTMPYKKAVIPYLDFISDEAKEIGAQEVTCWGDGSPLREFLYVDDLANLCVFLMNHYSGNETVNAGTGKELSIRELTEIVAKVVGYKGLILWDTTKPNGTPRKLLDVSKAKALGWTYRTELEDGIRLSYQDFLNNPMRAER